VSASRTGSWETPGTPRCEIWRGGGSEPIGAVPHDPPAPPRREILAEEVVTPTPSPAILPSRTMITSNPV
jgi:hypothetical protein